MCSCTVRHCLVAAALHLHTRAIAADFSPNCRPRPHFPPCTAPARSGFQTIDPSLLQITRYSLYSLLSICANHSRPARTTKEIHCRSWWKDWMPPTPLLLIWIHFKSFLSSQDATKLNWSDVLYLVMKTPTSMTLTCGDTDDHYDQQRQWHRQRN